MASCDSKSPGFKAARKKSYNCIFITPPLIIHMKERNPDEYELTWYEFTNNYTIKSKAKPDVCIYVRYCTSWYLLSSLPTHMRQLCTLFLYTVSSYKHPLNVTLFCTITNWQSHFCTHDTSCGKRHEFWINKHSLSRSLAQRFWRGLSWFWGQWKAKQIMIIQLRVATVT